MNKFTCLILAVALFALPSLAGDKTQNGGGLWGCMVGTTFKRGMLIDLFEARVHHELELIKPVSNDPFKIAADRMDFLRRDLPDVARSIESYMKKTLESHRFVEAILVDIKDRNPRIEPLPDWCPEGKWEGVQMAGFKIGEDLLIRKDLWNHAGLPQLDKGALLMHEAVYLWLRLEHQDMDSVRARQITGLVFSTLPAAEMRARIFKVLATPAPTPAPSPTPQPTPTPAPGTIPANEAWACHTENKHRYKAYIGYGPSQDRAQVAARKACRNGPEPIHCSPSIDCEAQTTRLWSCEGENRHSGKVYEETGRSKIEAQFRTYDACVKDTEGSRPDSRKPLPTPPGGGFPVEVPFPGGFPIPFPGMGSDAVHCKSMPFMQCRQD